MKSPKTTLVAILALIAGIAKASATVINGDGMPSWDDFTLILGGLGFLFARDNDRTDTESGADVAEFNRETKRSAKAINKTNTEAPTGLDAINPDSRSNTTMKIKKLIKIALVGLALAGTLAGTTGCESIKAFFANETVQKVAVNLGLSAVRLAVPIAFSEARDRINELDSAAFDALEASILAALENAVGADSAAANVSEAIAASPLPADQKQVVIDEMQAALVKESEAQAGTTAAGEPAENYGGPLFAALADARAKLTQSPD
ncbi:MAG: hypothetical protein Q7Q73_06175 [Verrucomicrobiota bacterium JB024]|nr:hypothetical protein [Verrucomicrobiota bacterium JB024]